MNKSTYRTACIMHAITLCKEYDAPLKLAYIPKSFKTRDKIKNHFRYLIYRDHMYNTQYENQIFSELTNVEYDKIVEMFFNWREKVDKFEMSPKEWFKYQQYLDTMI